MKISAIIPCYNYGTNILSNISLIEKELKKEFQDYEIIIINDGSTDDTKKKLKSLSKRKKIFLFHNKTNIGKSYSIIKGLKKAKGDKIFLIDCDLPYFKYINLFLKKLKIYQFVIIDRKNKKSLFINNKINFYQKTRHVVGKLISYIVCFFLKTKTMDTQSGMKGFDNIKSIKKQKFLSKRFFLDIEIINFLKKEKIIPHKVPVRYDITENSTIGLLDSKNIEILFELIKVLIKIKLN